MNSPVEQPKSFELPSQWEVDPRSLPMLVNQIMVQPGINAQLDGSGPAGVYLRFGHANTPIFPDNPTPDMVADLGTIPVTVVGQFYLTMDIVRNLRDSMDSLMKTFGNEAGTEDEH